MPNNNPVSDQTQINGQAIQPATSPRPILSTIDTWDHATQIDYPIADQNVGRRPGWNIPSIGITNESINTITQNQTTRNNSQQVAVSVRRPSNSQNVLQQWKTVPNMSQRLYTTSQAQINFSVNITTASAPDSPNFAIFRDGRKLSQIYSITTTAANHPTPVTGSYVDTTPGMKAFHSYELRWQAASSAVVSFQKDRTFQASNLRAQ